MEALQYITLEDLTGSMKIPIGHARMILANIPKHSIVTKKAVFEIISRNSDLPDSFRKCYNSLMSAHAKNISRAPTIEEVRNIQAATFAICS